VHEEDVAAERLGEAPPRPVILVLVMHEQGVFV
jgi:hypothetical protein